MKTKSVSYVVVLLIVIVALMRGCNTSTKVEEVTTYETIFVDKPVHDTIYKLNQRVIRIPVTDFVDISEDDSVYILTCETKHYRDSLYEAWVSGVDPTLDSIRVFNKITTRTITREVPKYITLANTNEKPLKFGGFLSGQSSFDINYINFQAGLELEYKKFGAKIGYNVGEHNYPYLGIEYKIR